MFPSGAPAARVHTCNVAAITGGENRAVTAFRGPIRAGVLIAGSARDDVGAKRCLDSRVSYAAGRQRMRWQRTDGAVDDER